MSNFDMRIPIKDLDVLEWKDGRIVLRLRPAFASVDPIVVEVPEVVLAHAMSNFPGAAVSELGPSLTRINPTPEMAAVTSLRPTSRAPVSSNALAGAQMPDTPAAPWSGDDELTVEEMEWLARSAG